MNFKTTYILFAVLLGILGLFLITQLRGKKADDQTAYVFPSMHEAKIANKDINGIEIERTGAQAEKLIFYRNDGGWLSKQPQTRADSSQLDDIVSQLMQAGKIEDKADMTAGLAHYGLDVPSATITLRMGAEKSWQLTIGKASIGKENALVYVTSSDRPNEPMAMKRSQLGGLVKEIDDKGDVVLKTLNDYRAKSLLAESPFDMTGITFQQPQHTELVLEKTSDGHWRFEKPAYGDADFKGESPQAGGPPPVGTPPQKITGVRELLQNVADIRVESDVDFGATDAGDAELADKGLEKGKEKLRIAAKIQPSFGGEDKKGTVTEALLIGKKADDKGEKYFARLESERNIVKVPARKVDAVLAVLANPAAIRNRDLVQIDSTKVDAMDVKPDGHEAFRLRHSGEPAAWKLYDSGKVQEGDEHTVKNLLTALTAERQVKEFPETNKSDADLGLDKPAAVLSIWVEGIKKEEKKDEAKEEKKDDKKDEKAKDDKKDAKTDTVKKEEKKDPNAEPKLKEDKPTVRLAFGKKEKDLVYVRRETGGEVTRLALPASLLDKVTEGKLAYLDRKLPVFGATGDVGKVVLTRGNQTLEIDKVTVEKAQASWKLSQPKDLAGRNADPGKVERMLANLHDLLVERFVAEKPTDSEMERFGLNMPTVKALLTITKPDKKTEDHVYLFGKDTDDKTGVYAKLGDRDLVFVVPKSVLGGLQGDFQDPVVFHFDLTKLKGVRLVGWQDIIGSPFTLDLERKDGQSWTAKAPANYKIDAAKIEAFAGGLTQLSAERFLGAKTASKPEYKLEVREGALDVYLLLDGEKEPVKLTIGGPSGNDGYHATISKLANEVFVIGKGSFGDVKSKPAYFKKQ